MLELPAALAVMRSGGDFTASYDALWRHYADCIQRDSAPACSFEDGKRALQITLAALQASQTGVPVKIGSI
jgi:predicted dehydrogenase